MAFFPDSFADGAIRRVGWLDREHEFAQGPVSAEFLSKLTHLYRNRVNQTRGYHRCELCAEPAFGAPMEIDGKAIKLGGAEVHVRSLGATVFEVPDLIYHYIVAHSYMPPKDFIDAVEEAK